jgi:hypothetical protein
MDRSEFDEEFYLAANPDVAMAVRGGHVASAFDHFLHFGQKEGRPGRAEDEKAGAPSPKAHRRAVLRILRGRGIEIGAFDSPCPVSDECVVTHCDRITVGKAKRIFPEVSQLNLQAPDVLIDLDRTGLREFEDNSQDFTILNHVIEHVANPIAVLGEVFRVTRNGGHVVLGAPDSRYTFDKARGITPFEHLLEEYEQKVSQVSLVHYFDLMTLLEPSIVSRGVTEIEARAKVFRERAEHAHVWDSVAFRSFVDRTLALLAISAHFVFEVTGDLTRHEYFAVLEKYA